MPSRDWKLRIQDILRAGQDIAEFTAEMTFEEFQQNKLVMQSVLYNFVIIGEAASNIPEAVKEQYPDIPWRVMSAMRNVLAHEYFRVNAKTVWKTARKSLPPVLKKLAEI